MRVVPLLHFLIKPLGKFCVKKILKIISKETPFVKNKKKIKNSFEATILYFMFIAVQDSHRYANDLILLFIMTLHSIVYDTLIIFCNFSLPKVIVI